MPLGRQRIEFLPQFGQPAFQESGDGRAGASQVLGDFRDFPAMPILKHDGFSLSLGKLLARHLRSQATRSSAICPSPSRMT